MQIHEAGGGIHYSVNHTKNATEEKLFESLKQRLNTFTSAGNCFFFLHFIIGESVRIAIKQIKAQHLPNANRVTVLSGTLSTNYFVYLPKPSANANQSAYRTLIWVDMPCQSSLVK